MTFTGNTVDVDVDKTFPGLPMELAEPKRNANTNGQIFLLILHRVLLFVFIFGCVIGVYVFVLGGDVENLCKTEIIVVTQPVNKSILIKNFGQNTKLRRKRQILRIDKNQYERVQNKKIERAEQIVSDFDALCNEKPHKSTCKEFVKTLKVLTDTKNSNTKEEHRKGEIFKRDAIVDTQLSEPALELNPNGLQSEALIESNNNCLLTRLLRQSGPYYYGYDNFKAEYQPDLLNYPRQIPMSFLPPYGRTHEDIQKPHPQDIEIALNIMSKQVPSEIFQDYPQGQLGNKRKIKPHPQDIETAMNIKSNCRPPFSKDSSVQRNCPSGTTACDNGDCINETLWCDGNVDCEDVSDETRCSCRERVDRTRLCDGYFDCPFGEDEMGCFGCSENTFSCEVSDGTQSMCYTKEQRCNNINDCPNHQDENDCTMLAPSLHNKPLFGISNTEGYLHRNFKGKWYAVCKNPYMWAHDACRRETGLIIRPPYIQEHQIDPLLKVNYINTAPGGLIHNSTSCYNSTAIYVTCPDLLCGTRILTSSQLIRENAENQLFGRNKRFLLHKHPYRLFFYDPLARAKRDVTREGNHESRKKRTESRVVGGKPSQPAAWPWVVALYRDGLFHCGGVIINQNWIMSAAHCVNKYWQHYYEVQVGMLRRFSFSPQEQNYRVTHVIVNQNYDQHDMKNDLSLLKVKPAIQFSRWIRPICLPGPEVAGADWVWGPPTGTLCTAVGWGSTIEHGPDPDHLREVELPIWEHCNHREDQDGNEICAGLVEGGRDTCQGDSGGPLLCQNPANEHQWYVAGIVSHGDGCARKGEPGVYTRVSLLLPWIKYHITSRNLPNIKPKQECPGFRCNSGIAKCLPKNRMFDKIIDCLDGEDEFNCEEKQPNIFEEILSIPFSKNANESAIGINNLIKKGPVKMNVSEPDQHLASTNQATRIVTSENTIVNNTSTFILTNSTDINHITNDTLLNNTKLDSGKNYTDTYLPDITTSSSNDESSEEITDDPIDFPTTTIETIYMNNLETHPFNLHGESMVSTSPDHGNIFLETETTASTLSNQNMGILSTTENVPPLQGDETKLNSSLTSEIPIIKNKQTTTLAPSVTEANTKLETSIKPTKDNVGAIIETVPTETSSNLDYLNNIVPEIENIIYTVEATKYKAKHKPPLHFRCHKIPQIISFKNRCDHKADCEDGTDELDCTCIDYLATFENQLICDGNYNCADGQDEVDCFGCDRDQFLCKRSQMCLSTKYVCDGKPQCPLGEDELDCFALTNGKDIRFDIDGRPKVRFDGFVTKKQNNDWHVICEDNMSTHEQEEAAVHICRYLGFSNANSYKIKYVNVKESNLHELPDTKRSKRNKSDKEPVMITYNHFDKAKQKSRNVIISEPELLKEKCLPNVTKTCMTLYVSCDQSLYTNFDVPQLFERTAVDNVVQQWPWVAKLYTNGVYKCTGVLIDVSWVLFRNECISTLNLQNPRYNTVVLGSHKTLFSTKSLYEQIRKVDGVKDLYNSKAVLLHLQEQAEYSTMVKPMIPSTVYMGNNKRALCVAVGEDVFNNTVSLLVKETREGCRGEQICFVRQSTIDTCTNGYPVERPWAGIISCHTKQGWYPAATFIEPGGECNIGNRLTGTEIENLKYQIKYMEERPTMPINEQEVEECDGSRCERGRCVSMSQVCDGVRHCEDGIDETPESCKRKHIVCSKDPLHRGCECPVGQLKCRNGQCISKELFKDGHPDCSDGTDEPGQTTCSDYLSRVMPSRLCDGVLHCHDRSDEDPLFCKCFAKNAFRCGKDASSEDYCIAMDMVCDGIPDCPNGEDERTCIGLSAPQGTLPGTGEVILRSHGVWYSKCYPTEGHTKSDLEDICREVGFIGGHAKQLPTPEKSYPHNNLVVDEFSDIPLNNNTNIRLRNSHSPIARATLDPLANCFRLFIECL